jgi:hypothetical protein
MDPTLGGWLVAGAVGPALVALPIDWTAGQLSGVARQWLERFRHVDGLSRLVQTAGTSVHLTQAQFASVRRLLEEPQTWLLIGSGTVEDLVREISACFAKSGDSDERDLVMARAIARGLLEFAVFDLEPELFQRILLARIARLEAGVSAALDHAMLRLNADLVAWFAHDHQEDEQRFRCIMTQLGQALNRLPPAPAGRQEVALYLATLIRWLGTDPWPRDPRLGGPVLTRPRSRGK